MWLRILCLTTTTFNWSFSSDSLANRQQSQWLYFMARIYFIQTAFTSSRTKNGPAGCHKQRSCKKMIRPLHDFAAPIRGELEFQNGWNKSVIGEGVISYLPRKRLLREEAPYLEYFLRQPAEAPPAALPHCPLYFVCPLQLQRQNKGLINEVLLQGWSWNCWIHFGKETSITAILELIVLFWKWVFNTNVKHMSTVFKTSWSSNLFQDFAIRRCLIVFIYLICHSTKAILTFSEHYSTE